MMSLEKGLKKTDTGVKHEEVYKFINNLKYLDRERVYLQIYCNCLIRAMMIMRSRKQRRILLRFVLNKVETLKIIN